MRNFLNDTIHIREVQFQYVALALGIRKMLSPSENVDVNHK